RPQPPNSPPRAPAGACGSAPAGGIMPVVSLLHPTTTVPEATVMAYAAEISRSNPTCLLFLIDQSKSMLGLIGGGQGKTKAEGVADAINHLVYSLVLRCVWGQAVLDRFHVGVLGYGLRVQSGLGGALAHRDLVPISEVARHPLRVEQRPQPGAAPGAPPARIP